MSTNRATKVTKCVVYCEDPAGIVQVGYLSRPHGESQIQPPLYISFEARLLVSVRP